MSENHELPLGDWRNVPRQPEDMPGQLWLFEAEARRQIDDSTQARRQQLIFDFGHRLSAGAKSSQRLLWDL